jgi:hypothetical protein
MMPGHVGGAAAGRVGVKKKRKKQTLPAGIISILKKDKDLLDPTGIKTSMSVL